MRSHPLRPASVPLSQAEPAPPLPDRMRVARMDRTGAPEVLHLAEAAVPQPVISELLVRVVAAGVNPIDAKTRAGAGVSAHLTPPSVLGFDFSGVVVRSPYDSHPLPVGTEVYGMVPFPRTGGSYAEYVVVPSQSVARKPAALSHVEAAGVPLAALTAWGLVVETAHAHEGQRMLIHAGAGGVGHFAVQLAAYFGADVTTTASGHNAAWLRELGARRVVDRTAERFEDVVSGMDVVIDLVGNAKGDETGTRSLGVLRRGGLYVNVPTGSWPEFRDAAAEAGVRATSYRVVPDGDVLATLARLLDSRSIQVFIDEVFPLEDAAAAHTAVESGHTRGKTVLQVSED